MKNFYLIIVLILITSGVSNSQQTKTYNEKNNGINERTIIDGDRSKISEKLRINSKGTESKWFDQITTVQALYGGFKGYYSILFPDTTILYEYSNGAYVVDYHSLAITLHPTSYIFDIWNKFTSYTIDSVQIGFFYKRKKDVVDTLVLQFSRVSDYETLKESDYSWVKTKFGVSSVTSPKAFHDMNTWELTDQNKLIGDGTHGKGTYKIPLTKAIADDTNKYGQTYLVYGLPTPIQIDNGKSFNMSYTFLPGFSYTPYVDTLNNFNTFEFVSFEQNENGLPTFLGDEDDNICHVMGYYDYVYGYTRYYSSIWYKASFWPEYHEAYFKLTALNVGVDDKNEVLNVEQNRPNPFNDITTIDYNLNKNSNVNLEVFNLTGSKVLSINEGNKSAGSHSITIDGKNLKSGIYFYTLTAGDYKVTKKMVVY